MKYIKTFEAIVYHGSPIEFDTFNTEHIGKTSGREFFGNGLYFSVDKKEVRKHGKYIYKVKIPAVKYFLNFNLSFEEQSKYIQKCLNKIDIETKDKMLKGFNRISYNNIIQPFKDDNINSKTYKRDLKNIINTEFMEMDGGRQIYYSLFDEFEYDTKKISDYLYSLGIIGNVYEHDGIINYVLFNANDIKVLNKNVINENLKIGDNTNFGKIQDETKTQFMIDNKWYTKTIVKPSNDISPNILRNIGTISPNMVIAAYENAIYDEKLKKYYNTFKHEMLTNDFPPIRGFPTIITNYEIERYGTFLNGNDITVDDIGKYAWILTDGFHRTLAAIKSNLPYLKTTIDFAYVGDENNYIN